MQEHRHVRKPSNFSTRKGRLPSVFFGRTPSDCAPEHNSTRRYYLDEPQQRIASPYFSVHGPLAACWIAG